MSRGYAPVRHSINTNRGAHGEHKPYVPGEYDHHTGIRNPEKRGYVRRWNHPDSVQGPGGLLARLEPFTGNSIRAVKERMAGEVYGFIYKVYSYDVCIAYWMQPHAFGVNKTPRAYLDVSYYSAKTREHQNMVNAWMGHAVDKWIAPELDDEFEDE